MKRWKRWLLALLAVLLMAALGFVIWAETPMGPMPEALDALQSGQEVRVETTPWLTFSPLERMPSTGLIFYPGGRVDPRSYAPPARTIAAAGYLVVIPPMPLNLAFLGIDRAADVMAAHPEIRRWMIGGHSLGGAMAAGYASNHPGLFDAVALWASYPPDSDPLTSFEGAVLSIYGTEDMGIEAIEARKGLLPTHTQWVVLPGGNHAFMGWYGLQPGDGTASISREEQQELVIEATLAVLRQLDMGGGE